MSPFRFIEATNARVFDTDCISSTEAHGEWNLATEAAAGRLSVLGGRAKASANGGLAIGEVSASRVSIDLEAPVEAAAAHLFTVDVTGLHEGQWVRLYWAREGERLDIARSVTSRFRDGQGEGTRTFSLSPADSPQWRGVIRRLRIEIASDPGQLIGIADLRSRTRKVDGRSYREALIVPWYVEAGGEHRLSLLAPPDHEIRRTVHVPPGATLEFAYSHARDRQAASALQVIVEHGSNRSKLFEASTPKVVSGAAENGWIESQVDLGDYSGRVVTIVLRAEAEEPFDPLDGVSAWGHPEIRWPSEVPAIPNVVIISLDTLRADHTTMYGYPRQTTPNIASWAERAGTLFRTAVAPAPWTLPSHVSLFTGQDSLLHGVIHTDPAPGTLTTLAEVLREAGYTTAAVTGGSYLNPIYGLSQGFDRHRSVGGDLETELERELSYALEWLASRAAHEPFFLFFHTYEIHDPYTPREPYLSLMRGSGLNPAIKDVITSPDGASRTQGYRPMRIIQTRFKDADRPPQVLPWQEVQVAIDLYDSGIAFTDHAIGELLTWLENSSHADRTIVVLLSDHGEAFGEHGFASHSSLYDHDLLVPLIIAPVAGSRVVREVETQVRLIDVMPTILELVGIDTPDGVNGWSLASLMLGKPDGASRAAFSYAAVTNFGIGLRSETWKYIFRNSPHSAIGGWEEFYDLATDPGETVNLASTQSTKRYHLSAVTHLDEHLGGLWITVSNPGPEVLSGYLESTAIGIGTRTTATRPTCRLVGGHRLEYSVPSRESLTLVIERLDETSVSLSGNVFHQGREMTGPFELRVAGLEVASRRSIGLTDGQWVEGNANAGAPKVTIEWRPPPGEAAAPVEIEGDLEEQLRALGYIQ